MKQFPIERRFVRMHAITHSVCLMLLAGVTVGAALEPAQVLKVWPEGAPGPVNDTGPERILPTAPGGKQALRVEGVTDPTLLVYPAPGNKSTGTAIIICPGGGFSKVVPDLEGSEIAENFNALGITAFVLKYRTTPSGKPEPQAGPVMDAQRSVSLVRAKAEEFGVKADRIGLLGVSAGGQVAVIATCNHAQRSYPLKDAVDKVSCRPDFLALIYPWRIQDASDATKLRADIHVDKTLPPVFMAHAADDKGAKIEGSLLLFLQLQAAGIPTEAHLYAKGGHGFGLRPADVPCPTDWPLRFAEWLRVMGLAPAM